jgi:hypothetical protein
LRAVREPRARRRSRPPVPRAQRPAGQRAGARTVPGSPTERQARRGIAGPAGRAELQRGREGERETERKREGQRGSERGRERERERGPRTALVQPRLRAVSAGRRGAARTTPSPRRSGSCSSESTARSARALRHATPAAAPCASWRLRLLLSRRPRRGDSEAARAVCPGRRAGGERGREGGAGGRSPASVQREHPATDSAVSRVSAATLCGARRAPRQLAPARVGSRPLRSPGDMGPLEPFPTASSSPGGYPACRA